MGRTIVTGRASIPLFLAYRCSKCGQLNVTVQIVSETGQETKSGTIHRKSTKEKMGEDAIGHAKGALNDRVAKIFGKDRKKVFRAAEFKCRCSKCKRKEPWSRMRFSNFETTISALSVMGGLVAVVFLFYGEFLVFLKLGAIIGIIMGAWFLYKHLKTKAMEKQIEMLPKESIPIIALSQPELIEAASDYFSNMNTESA